MKVKVTLGYKSEFKANLGYLRACLKKKIVLNKVKINHGEVNQAFLEPLEAPHSASPSHMC